MSGDYWLYGLGFLAQVLFGLRMVSQWISSEIAGHSVSPLFFWKSSLVASLLFIVYGILRTDVVIVSGQMLAYYIYLRNLQLKGEWCRIRAVARYVLWSLPAGLCLWIFLYRNDATWFMWPSSGVSSLLLPAGLAGQLLLNLRFVIQWVYAERMGVSFFPTIFWVLSVAGSFMVLTYALHRADPVLILSQSLAMFVYVRNIVLNMKTPDPEAI